MAKEDHSTYKYIRACEERCTVILEQLLTNYLHRDNRQTSDKTLAYYRIGLRDWVEYCWPNPQGLARVSLLLPNKGGIEAYIKDLLSQGGHLENSRRAPLAIGSVSSYLSGIRAFYDSLVWVGALDANPFYDIPVPVDPRKPNEKRKSLPVEYYKKLIGVTKTLIFPNNLKLELFLRLMGEQGLRVSELTALELGDIDMSRELITIRGSKSGNSNVIPMNSNTRACIEEWLSVRANYARADEPKLLVNAGKKVKSARQGRGLHSNTVRLQLETLYAKANVPEEYKGCHILRHMAANSLFLKTRDIGLVSQLLGHKCVGSSGVYLDASREELLADTNGLRVAINL